MLKEFKAFINQGNAIDLAVGVMIGAAFGKIVNSIVTDLITPIVSLALGRVNLLDKFIPLAGQTATSLEEAKKAGPVLAYGAFINTCIEFLIVAFTIFIIVRQINRFRRVEPAMT